MGVAKLLQFLGPLVHQGNLYTLGRNKRIGVDGFHSSLAQCSTCWELCQAAAAVLMHCSCRWGLCTASTAAWRSAAPAGSCAGLQQQP